MIGRGLAIAGLIVGLVAVLLQFSISMPLFIEAGRSVPGAIIRFFSFFTILTNIAVVLTYGFSLFGRSEAFFAKPGVRAAVATSITVVMIVYAAVLARLWQPDGLFLVCDILLHYVAPVIYGLWWILAGRDGAMRWRDIPFWLAYPVIYLAYVMLRAPIAGEVPYPFLDLAANPAGTVVLAIAGIFTLFVAIAAAVVAIDKRLGRKRLQ